MANIQTVDLSQCFYDRKNKVLKMKSEFIGMPAQLFMFSHHTGKTVRFVAIDCYDVLYDEDGWDGEQCIYRPMGNVPNVDHLVIYNEY
jgi:hypothetical protein